MSRLDEGLALTTDEARRAWFRDLTFEEQEAVARELNTRIAEVVSAWMEDVTDILLELGAIFSVAQEEAARSLE